MDYSDADDYEKESRRTYVEYRANGIEKCALPYCINSFCVMVVQPNQDVSSYCDTFGFIDNLSTKSAEETWNCGEYQLLRETMFIYDMLPEYCKNCRAFVRHDYIKGRKQ